MSRTYALFRWIAARWLWMVFALIASTVIFGLIGFAKADAGNWSTKLYLIALLFLLNCGDVAKDVNWQLDIARWLGFVTWFTTIAAVLINLFSHRALDWFVWATARNHVVIAGLGTYGEELVGRLRQRGEDVIVLSSASNSSQDDACRDLGAIVLKGDPALPRMLKRACLDRAKRLLVLLDDDQATLQIITEAYRIVRSSGDRPSGRKVRCVAKVNEPGLQDVIRQHQIYRDATDRFSLSLINLYELCVCSMLSLARWRSATGELRRIALLGLGPRSRFAESLIVRAAKDQLVDQAGRLEVHVYDYEAERFLRELAARHPFLATICDLQAHACSATGCGVGKENDFPGTESKIDAAFVCVDDESRATIQGMQLASWLKEAPVLVLSRDARKGLGTFLNLHEAIGGVRNLLTVGFEDMSLDADVMLDPQRELVARACHNGYLATVRAQIAEAETKGDSEAARRLREKPANMPWEDLSHSYRQENRAAVANFTTHLRATDPLKKPTAYAIFERLRGHVGQAEDDFLRFSAEEIEFLAEREHERWMKSRIAAGWRYGPERNETLRLHPQLVPYDQLDESTQEYDRAVFRQLPRVLARANFVIKPVSPVDAENDFE